MAKAQIHIIGVVGQDITLLDVIRQYKSFDNPSEVEVMIDSPGGYVDEGMSIYNYLRRLTIPVTTHAKFAASIAASIYMAGDKRVIDADGEIMIHMPFASGVTGDSETLDRVSKELKALEKNFIDFYSNYTSIDEESIRELLKKETWLSAEEALGLGLATEIKAQEFKAVALFNDNDLDVNFNNNEDKEKENFMSKAKNLIKALESYFNPQPEVEIVALVRQDAIGTELNFPEVQEGEQPEVGTTVEVDGQPANGDFLMPGGETMVVEGGKLKEILPAEEQEETEEEAPEANAEGETETETEVEAEANAEEPEAEVEEEFDVEALMTQLEERITERVQATFTEKEEKLQAEIVALRKTIGSDFNAGPNYNENESQTSGNFLTNALRARK